MKKKLVIIDFGAGNLKSVFNALQTFENVEVSVTNSADIIKHADFIVMPGVGAFDKAIKNLTSIDGLINVLKRAGYYKKTFSRYLRWHADIS